MKKNIAIVHPQIRTGGGSEARPLWLAESLKSEFEVDLITLGEVDIERLNVAYGTNLRPGDIRIISLPIWPLVRKRFDALRAYRLHRFCKQHVSDYAVMISTYNVMDFGKPGIQFIADFSFNDELRDRFFRTSYQSGSLLYRRSFIRFVYLKFADCLSGIKKRGWMQNITVANSEWSRNVINNTYHMDCIVIYPPVLEQQKKIPWEQKNDEFLVLVRISPEKEIETVIDILKEVRNRGHNITLRICGRTQNNNYGNYIKKLVTENATWISMDGLVTGNRKFNLIASCRYGISGRRYEPFGISSAEMIKAGAIVWVPDGGGQKEIVSHSNLIYKGRADAVAKIDSVLKSQGRQQILLKHLAQQSELFSTKIFSIASRNLLKRFIDSLKNRHIH